MKCAKCEKDASGKSKYCREHKQEARTKWIEMIQEKEQEKRDRQVYYADIWEEACRAGREAGSDHTPQPMVVQEHANMMNDHSPVVKQWIVPSGMCGFAWIICKDRKFNNWLLKQGYGKRDSYYHGVNIWISEYGQSYERKDRHAHAMAESLNKNGIDCYAGSRLD